MPRGRNWRSPTCPARPARGASANCSNRIIPKSFCPATCKKTKTSRSLFQAVKETYGKIHFLVHSIAFAPPQELRESIRGDEPRRMRLAMEISVYSFVAASRAAAALMTEGGTIITISYYGGEKVMPGYNVMGVCKAALEHSVRYLAWDLGREKIRVNCISAGPMRTLSAAGIAGFDQLREHAAQKSPLARNVEPKELGAAALYLLSDQSSGVTGETIHVDCGYSIVGL